jgi:polar amino acid transport system permease protein
MAGRPDDTAAADRVTGASRTALILVAATAALSLLFAIQYYLGGPIRLPVISEVLSVAVSPDQRSIAAGSQDGMVRVWNMPAAFSSAILAEFDLARAPTWPVQGLTGHRGAVIELVYEPESGDLISVDSQGEVRFWDPAQGKPTRSMTIDGPVSDVDFSRDLSTMASVGTDNRVALWSVETGQLIGRLGSPASARWAVALSGDGVLIAAGMGSHIQVWDAQTGTLVWELAGNCESQALETEDECLQDDKSWLAHTKAVTALAFSPDGALLASGSADTTVLFWNIQTGKVASSSEGHWGPITSLQFDPEGRAVLSTGADNVLKTLRLPGGKSSGTYGGHFGAVERATWGPLDTMLVSASSDGTIRVWETANQYTIHMEWSRLGLQRVWGRTLAGWMLVSGILGLVAAWGLSRIERWSHILAMALFMLGPIVVIGLPLFEVLGYPLVTVTRLRISWPLILLAVWYTALLVALMREPVALLYEAPRSARLAEQLQASQRTIRLRFGVYGVGVWIGLLVLLFTVLRRFKLDVAFMGHFFSFIMGGASITLYISAASIALAVVLALLGALGRLSRNPIANGISSFYISLIRGTPLLVQIFVWYLGLPQLGIRLEAELAGILALGVNYGAYMTEVFRAGIQAIGKGQHEAAHALGMTRGQTFRRIVLPQAFRIVIPPIGNEFIAMMKDSSLVYVMGVWELTFRANKVGRQNFRAMETFLIAAAFYWVLTVAFQFLQGKLETRMARGERK